MLYAMTTWGLVVYGIAGFIVAVLTGITGAGGGFVITPLGIILGLTPAQSVSAGKFSGLSIAIGSLVGMNRAHGRVSWQRIVPVMMVAFIVGLLAPFAIKTLDSQVYRVTLGIMLLMMIPVLLRKRIGIERRLPSSRQRVVGGGLLVFAFLLQGIFSGGLGSLVNIVLMGMLGMTAIEANITKRWSQIILNFTIIIGVVWSGLVVWRVVAVGILSTFGGSIVGGRLAVKHGDEFVMRIMIGLLVVSALALIFGA